MLKRGGYRKKSLIWRPRKVNVVSQVNVKTNNYDFSGQSVEGSYGHSLVNHARNKQLRGYELSVKDGFDKIKPFIDCLTSESYRTDFEAWAQNIALTDLGFMLPSNLLQGHIDSKAVYRYCLFKQFMSLSEEFFQKDPLGGQNKELAESIFKQAGFHAVGIAPCADGRLAHLISYVLRLPYSSARRKAHAGALFDVSESVRNWVFIEHNRFREGIPNSALEPTKYLKIAVYHYSKSDPHHQGCAAHGSDDTKAASAALTRLKDFRQAIENRFGCGSTVQTLLIGVNTDDDSMKVHVPNEQGKVCLNRFVETNVLFQQTQNLNAEQARWQLENAIDRCNLASGSTAPQASMNKLIAWLIENNFSQIAYVNEYENGCYADIGHAERFIGIGDGFEEVQLRNLTYYSFLNTIEEGANDIDVGIKIFKSLNIKNGMPIPVVIRCDFDGRVPGSRDRAEQKALRIEQALHQRYKELSTDGLIISLCTLRDKTSFRPAEHVIGLAEQSV